MLQQASSDVTPEIIRGERDRATLLKHHLETVDKANDPGNNVLLPTLVPIVEEEASDENPLALRRYMTSASEFKKFIVNDFQKQMTTIDRKARLMR